MLTNKIGTSRFVYSLVVVEHLLFGQTGFCILLQVALDPGDRPDLFHPVG